MKYCTELEGKSKEKYKMLYAENQVQIITGWKDLQPLYLTLILSTVERFVTVVFDNHIVDCH